MSREEIAQYLGLRSETVSRCFSELARPRINQRAGQTCAGIGTRRIADRVSRRGSLGALTKLCPETESKLIKLLRYYVQPYDAVDPTGEHSRNEQVRSKAAAPTSGFPYSDQDDGLPASG